MQALPEVLPEVIFRNMLAHLCAQVTAGTVVFEAPIVVRAAATGAGSTLAGIGRLVAAAQAREAPVQRLADTIAGRFCFSVMAASAATFAFWSTFGAFLPRILSPLPGFAGLLASLVSDRFFFNQLNQSTCPCLQPAFGRPCCASSHRRRSLS